MKTMILNAFALICMAYAILFMIASAMPKSKDFHGYGSRGISICEEWKNDFQAFYDWAMAHGYIDNEGHDRPACVTCKNKHKLTVEAPCYDCIDNVDLALHKPNYETNFANYEKEEKGGDEK